MLNLEQLAELLEKNRAAASARVRNFSIGGKKFNFNSQPAVMGVVNLSADSWYRESVCLTAAAAVRRGKVLAAQGADIVDIGAESTLAHAVRVADMAQTGKLIPVIKQLRAAKIPVSSRNLFTRRYSRLPRSGRECSESYRRRRFHGNFQDGRGARRRRDHLLSCRAKTSAKSATSI